MIELTNNPYKSMASTVLEAVFLCNMVQHASKRFQRFPGRGRTSWQHERDMEWGCWGQLGEGGQESLNLLYGGLFVLCSCAVPRTVEEQRTNLAKGRETFGGTE